MLSVYRCSQVAFLGETIMEEAKLCTERHLRKALENGALQKNIQGEVYENAIYISILYNSLCK